MISAQNVKYCSPSLLYYSPCSTESQRKHDRCEKNNNVFLFFFFIVGCTHIRFPHIAEKARKIRSFSVQYSPTAAVYSFTAPIITPLVKYFCRNGYKHKIGITDTMIVAYLIISLNAIISALLVAISISVCVFSIKISRKNSCRGYKFMLRR